MKSKFFLVALVAIAMVAGMVFVSCGSSCPTGGACATPTHLWDDICWFLPHVHEFKL